MELVGTGKRAEVVKGRESRVESKSRLFGYQRNKAEMYSYVSFVTSSLICVGFLIVAGDRMLWATCFFNNSKISCNS